MTLRLFPTLLGLGFPVVKTPMWSTDKTRSVSGKVTTLARWSYPIYRIEQPFEFLRGAAAYLDFQTLLAFYNLANGAANLFRFNDPNDNAVTAQSFGSGDGSTLTFQLLRAITGAGGIAWNDPVFYPTGTPAIYVDGVLKTSGVDYTISATGVVTFAVAPGAGLPLTWTGTYDWLVRFDEDTASFEEFMQRLYSLKKIAFSTEKI